MSQLGNRSKIVTTEEIARELNLSRSTVSRALNNNAVVKKETRNRVVEAAERLGFRPNRAARHLVLNQAYTLGFVHYSQPAYFWQEVQTGIQKARHSLHDYGVTVDVKVTDITDEDEQARALRDMAERGVNGIAVSPSNPSRLVSVIDDLSSLGVPVLTVSSDIPESRRLCYVGADYYRAGRIAGEMMGKLTGGSGRVGLLTFSGAVMSIQQRIIGFRDAIGHFPGNDILGPFRLSRTGEDVYDFTVQLLREEPGLTGIFVSYGVLDSVGEAVRDSGLGSQVTVVGYDLSKNIAALMREDAIDATICQEPFNQGYYPVEILYHYVAEGRKPFRNIVNIKLELVTKENLPYYETESDYYNFLLTL